MTLEGCVVAFGVVSLCFMSSPVVMAQSAFANEIKSFASADPMPYFDDPHGKVAGKIWRRTIGQVGDTLEIVETAPNRRFKVRLADGREVWLDPRLVRLKNAETVNCFHTAGYSTGTAGAHRSGSCRQ